MKYFENSSKNGDRLLCRVENFIPYHDGLRALLTDGDVMRILHELMGEAPVLFKEKINAKLLVVQDLLHTKMRLLSLRLGSATISP